MNSTSAPMLRAERCTSDPHCPYKCCTDWAPGGRSGRSHRRIRRSIERDAWRRDIERNEW